MFGAVMRFPISSVIAVALLSSCSTLTEDREPTADCVTGTHWVGGDTGHEEMHPGRDCVGCHRENDGPPLALGGTIYPLAGQAKDCYGEPGVTVLVKDANNKVFQFETNAAGNFYLEGDESLVAKPISMKIRWTAAAATTAAPAATTPAPAATAPLDQWVTVPPGNKEKAMLGMAMTGDCGSCHGAGGTPKATGQVYFFFPWPHLSLGRPKTDFPNVDFTKK